MPEIQPSSTAPSDTPRSTSSTFAWYALPLAAALATGAGTYLWSRSLRAGALGALFGAAVVTDLRRYVIPNRLVTAAALSGVALRLGQGNPLLAWAVPALVALIALLAVRMFSVRLFQRPGLGMGDVKLGAVMGLYLGWPVFWALYLAFVLGGAIGGIGLLTGHLRRETRLPFAPFLAAGALLAAWAPYALFMSYLREYVL
jgi:prepilin signal peptidase PulO-like enzyme (type II secretory pathway)